MRLFTRVVLGLCCCVLLSGCGWVKHWEVGASSSRPPKGGAKVKKSKGHGPPPHAPAHGYRHKHEQGVELQYDSGVGAYAAVGLQGVYFNNDLYLRIVGGYWQASVHFGGPWRVAAPHEVPEKLFKAKGKGGPGKSRGKGPDKGNQQGRGKAKGKAKR